MEEFNSELNKVEEKKYSSRGKKLEKIPQNTTQRDKKTENKETNMNPSMSSRWRQERME